MRDSIFLTFVHHFYSGLVKGTGEKINDKALENMAQSKYHTESNTALFSIPTNGFTLPINCYLIMLAKPKLLSTL